MTEPQNPRVTQAVEWLRAISTWLLETDNDMKLPNGILDVDPLDIADALEAAEAASKAREAALVEAANRVCEAEANPDYYTIEELLSAIDDLRAALTKEPGA